MKISSINILILVILIKFCNGNGYDYPKPELKFDCEDAQPSIPKPKVLRGVFLYTYDDNYEGREVEMHELNLESFNKLVSSSDYVKTPTAVKSTFNFIEFFDGRCQASVNCEKILQECPPVSPCSRTHTTTPKPLVTTTTESPPSMTSKSPSTTTSKPSTISSTTTTKPPTTKSPPLTTTTSWPSNYELQKEVSDIFNDFAPQLTEPHLMEIMTALKNMNTYTQYWTASQVDQISTRNSLIVQQEMLKQNTTANAVMRFSDELKQHMVNYSREINPDMTLDEILGMISIVEEIGTATMRYLTFDQYKGLRGPVVSAFAENTVVNGFVTTTKAPTKAPSVTTTTSRPVTTTSKSPPTSTSKPPTTTTKKPATTTKTYIPPPGSLRKPYTRWVGQTYRQFTGHYSFGYTWKPFTGGISWKSRRYSAGSTTTTERYRQKSLVNELNPVVE